MTKKIDSVTNIEDPNQRQIWMEQVRDAINSLLPVYETTVTTAVDYIDIRNLDGIKHGGYHLECALFNDTGNAEEYFLYINGDTTQTNYYTRYVYGTGGAPITGTVNKPHLCSSTANHETAYVVGDMVLAKNPNDGDYDFRYIGLENRKARNNLESVQWSLAHKNVQTGITSLRIGATDAGGIGVGSTIRLWRKV